MKLFFCRSRSPSLNSQSIYPLNSQNLTEAVQWPVQCSRSRPGTSDDPGTVNKSPRSELWWRLMIRHELIISSTIRISSSIIAKSWRRSWPPPPPPSLLFAFISWLLEFLSRPVDEVSVDGVFVFRATIIFVLFLANKLNRLFKRWQTYGWRLLNLEDMLAKAARQFVCKYLSRILVMLNCMVRMTTSMSRLPRLISERRRSVNQLSRLIIYKNFFIFI